MAQSSPSNLVTPIPDPISINLVRLLARFHQILITPDSETEARLRVSESERAKVGANLEFARKLLSRLEHQAQTIPVPCKKQEAETDLARKRQKLQKFAERLQQLNDLAEYEEEFSDHEDLLREDTPANETSPPLEPYPVSPSPMGLLIPEVTASTVLSETSRLPSSTPAIASKGATDAVLRARHKAEKTELLLPAASTTGVRVNAATAESLLTHNRTEQENLTIALLNMARTLKSSSQAFSMTLEEEKNVLDSATKGLDQNELGLEAAQRRMGLLRTMTEGKGWWGRMLMYFWIAGLALVAFLIVFLMPKLRL